MQPAGLVCGRTVFLSIWLGHVLVRELAYRLAWLPWPLASQADEPSAPKGAEGSTIGRRSVKTQVDTIFALLRFWTILNAREPYI